MIARHQRIAAWLKSRKVELGLGVRVTVAAMGALVIALAFGLKLPLWAVLTSIIVTPMSVGRSLQGHPRLPGRNPGRRDLWRGGRGADTALR